MSENQPVKINFNRVYAGSTNNVFKTVMIDKADAGATLDVDLGNAPPEVMDHLRPIMTTDDISPHPLAAHPRVPEEIRQRVKETVLLLGEDEANREMLKTIRMPQPMEADYDRDYKSIETVDIRALANEKGANL